MLRSPPWSVRHRSELEFEPLALQELFCPHKDTEIIRLVAVETLELKE